MLKVHQFNFFTENTVGFIYRGVIFSVGEFKSTLKLPRFYVVLIETVRERERDGAHSASLSFTPD